MIDHTRIYPTDSDEVYHTKAIKCEVLNKKAYRDHYNQTAKSERDTEIFIMTTNESNKSITIHARKLAEIVGKERANEIIQNI